MKKLTVQITDHHNGQVADDLIAKVIEAAERTIGRYEKTHPDADFMSQLGTEDCPDELVW